MKKTKETFVNLKASGLKLNPKKYVFGVSRGKMLGYTIGPEGNRANPDKMKAIILMVEPSTKQRGPEAHRKDTCLKQIHFKIS
jgi:hypothetical protein